MQKLRVLVADDRQEVRWAVTRMLSECFEIVGSVTDGQKLVAAAQSLSPHVIVSDVDMPLLTGPEAIRVLGARGLNIPVVLMSAYITDAEQYIEAGATAVVDKIDIGYDLAVAIRAANDGQTYLSRSLRLSSNFRMVPA